MSSQLPLKCLIGREVFEIAGRVYRWEDAFLWSMARSDWEQVLTSIRLTLACATALRGAGRKIASRHVEETAAAFRYAHKLESAAAMRQWLSYWRLSPERWRQAILLQTIQLRSTDTDKTSFAKTLQPNERQLIRWLRPLGAVTGAFQELVEQFAGHAAIHDSVLSKVAAESSPHSAGRRGQVGGGEAGEPLTDAAIYDGVNDSAAIYLGLVAPEVHDKLQHLLTIERSIEQFRLTVATADGIRRQITGNLMGWTRIRYDVLSFASAAAAREAADCIRLDGEAPEDVAERAMIAIEQVTRFYGELERPAAAVLLSAPTNEWIGPLEIAGRHQLFRARGKTPPRPDDTMVIDRVAMHLLTQAIEKERRERVRWRWSF
jgi:hypothetical protein